MKPNFRTKMFQTIAGKVWRGPVPDFLIVGAQKAGTSSLYYYLSRHPLLAGSVRKEVHYFSRDQHYRKGLDWYRKQFLSIKMLRPGVRAFEASPSYLYRKAVAQRIYLLKPDMKIIILLREPVARAFSAWNMYRSFSLYPRLPGFLSSGALEKEEQNIVNAFYTASGFPDFETYVGNELQAIEQGSEDEEPGILRRGIYWEQVNRYFDLFSRDRVLVLGSQALKTQLIPTLNRVLAFLDLPESEWQFLPAGKKKNVKAYPVPLESHVKQQLQEFYRPYNQKLFTMLGQRPDW